MPLGDAKLDGEVWLVPTGSGDYDLGATVWGESHISQWVLARSTCGARSAGDPLLRKTPLSKMVVRNEWAMGPLTLRGEDANDGSLLTCVDLPVDAARARQPLPGRSPAVVPLRPVHSTGFVTAT